MAGALQLDAIVEGPSAVLGWPPSGPIHPYGIARRGFLARMTSHAVLANQAKNGRSSKSYLAEGLWREALGKPADVVLIHFGHNDQPGKGPDRETDPATTYRENLARYVDETRAAGAIPVIVTSLTRRSYNASEHIVADQLVPYVEAARAVAAETRAPLVDLYAASVALLNRVGPNVGDTYGVVLTDGTLDRTHLSPAGSAAFGAFVADGDEGRSQRDRRVRAGALRHAVARAAVASRR